MSLRRLRQIWTLSADGDAPAFGYRCYLAYSGDAFGRVAETRCRRRLEHFRDLVRLSRGS